MKLHQSGFKVPVALCWPCKFLAELFSNNPDSSRSKEFDADLKGACEVIRLPVVVRSSGLEEDTRRRSRAGEYLSLVANDSKQLTSAIRKVHDSGKGVSVIVQELVKSRISGVTFTDYGKGMMIVESAYGYCHGITGSITDPDRFFVDRKNNFFIARRLGAKQKIGIIRDGHFDSVTSDYHHSESFTLTLEKAKHIAMVFIDVENVFGIPQNIEWSIDEDGVLILLQSRAIVLTGC